MERPLTQQMRVEEREAKHRQQQMKVMEESIREKQAQVDKLESTLNSPKKVCPHGVHSLPFNASNTKAHDLWGRGSSGEGGGGERKKMLICGIR